jgi:hypothetical protein
MTAAGKAQPAAFEKTGAVRALPLQ